MDLENIVDKLQDQLVKRQDVIKNRLKKGTISYPADEDDCVRATYNLEDALNTLEEGLIDFNG